jgi:hypothetical protein
MRTHLRLKNWKHRERKGNRGRIKNEEVGEVRNRADNWQSNVACLRCLAACDQLVKTPAASHSLSSLFFLHFPSSSSSSSSPRSLCLIFLAPV